MKIFSNHRKKLEPYRRFGGREFKDKLVAAKNHKRMLNPNSEKGFFSGFFSKTGMSQAGTYTGLAGLAAIFYFLVISPYFLVSHITVSGNQLVSSQEIKNTVDELGNHRFFLVHQNSFFILNQGRLNAVLTKSQPMIKEAKTTRSWPNKLKIEIIERNPALVLLVNQKSYLIDDLGFVIKEVDSTSPEMKVQDQVDEDVKTGEMIDGKLIPFIISMEKSWPSRLNIPIRLAKIPGKGSTEVEFVSQEGWSALFSTDRPVSTQLNSLVLLLNKQIPGKDRSNLAYIDLRLAKWAYYCFKSTPCQQTDPQQAVNDAQTPETAGVNTSQSADTVTKP